MAEKAIELFSTIKNPNEILLSLLFASCSQVGTKEAFSFGRTVWFEMSLVHHKDKFILSSALDMFISCGDVLNAEKLFMKLKAGVIDYGQMMKCYNNEKTPVKTINLYKKMRNEGVEGSLVIFILLADACAQISMKSYCQWIVSEIPRSLLADVKLQTALIHMWVSDAGFCIKISV